MTIPKTLKMFGYDWQVHTVKTRAGGAFNWQTKVIHIGTENKGKEDVFCHEILEALLVHGYHRYTPREGSSEYLFSFNHTDLTKLAEQLSQFLKDNDLLK